MQAFYQLGSIPRSIDHSFILSFETEFHCVILIGLEFFFFFFRTEVGEERDLPYLLSAGVRSILHHAQPLINSLENTPKLDVWIIILRTTKC